MKTTHWRHLSDPSGISSNGCKNAKQRIAAALCVDPGTIKLDRFKLDLPGWTFHCTGRLHGARFFAKIYLTEFNPPLRRIPRSVTPEKGKNQPPVLLGQDCGGDGTGQSGSDHDDLCGDVGGMFHYLGLDLSNLSA